MDFINEIHRILDAGVKKFGNAKTLAERCGVSTVSLSRWRNSDSVSLKTIAPVIDAIGVRLVLPDEGTDEMRLPLCKMDGGGLTPTGGQSSLPNLMDLDGKADLCVVVHAGSSMAPTLVEGDILICDKTDVVPNDGGLFLVASDNHVFVRRLFRTINGELLLKADNQEYPAFQVHESQCRLLARIVWIVKRAHDAA